MLCFVVLVRSVVCKVQSASGVWSAELLVCHGAGERGVTGREGGLFAADGLVMCEDDGRDERETRT